MTHYLRRGGDTLIDVEAMEDDLSSAINVVNYSLFLLSEPSEKRGSIMRDFDALSEIRGTWHEGERRAATPDELAGKFMRAVADRHGLFYVTD